MKNLNFEDWIWFLPWIILFFMLVAMIFGGFQIREDRKLINTAKLFCIIEKKDNPYCVQMLVADGNNFDFSYQLAKKILEEQK